MEYKDLFGKEITVGSYVVYAALWDRSAMLKIGEVVGLAKRKDNYNDKVIPTIKVKGVEMGWNNKPKPNSKTSTLSFLDRLIVVSKESISAEFLAAIEEIKN